MAVILLALYFAVPAHGATVSLSHVHVSLHPGANKPAVYALPSGLRTIYFDYTVAAPYSSDTGQIVVYANGTKGAPVAEATLIFDLSAALYATLQPQTGTFPDGGYCAVLVVDGQPDTDGDRMPIGWTIGKGTLPAPCSKKLGIGSISIHRSHELAGISLVVRDNHRRAVAGASVRLDGHSAGLPHVLSAKTNENGVATFSGLRIMHPGSLTITASKPGYRGGVTSIHLRP